MSETERPVPLLVSSVETYLAEQPITPETLQEAGFIGNLLTMPEEHALEELQTKMQGADERAYRMLKLTIIGMIRTAQAAMCSPPSCRLLACASNILI